MEVISASIFIVFICLQPLLTASVRNEARGARGRIHDEESYVKVKDPDYNVKVDFNQDERGKCSYTVNAYGRGIVDSFTLDCEEGQQKDSQSAKSKRYLLYGRPMVDPLCLFSDERSTLMVIQGGKCAKRTYSTPFTTTYSFVKETSKEACQELCRKINNVENDPNLYNSDGENVPIEYVGGGDDKKDDDDKGSALQGVWQLLKSLVRYWYS